MDILYKNHEWSKTATQYSQRHEFAAESVLCGLMATPRGKRPRKPFFPKLSRQESPCGFASKACRLGLSGHVKLKGLITFRETK